MTLEKGSHNVLPFSNTYRTVLPSVYLNRLVHHNWEVYIRDSLRNDYNMDESVVDCFESYLSFTKPLIDTQK